MLHNSANSEQLAFLRICLPQVQVGLFGFGVAWKKLPDLQHPNETPKYVKRSQVSRQIHLFLASFQKLLLSWSCLK